MASLVEELVNILEAEQKVYETLTGYEEKKKDVLIRADVPALEEITNLEQLAGDELIAYSNKQVQALTDIATVLGKTEEKMTVTRLIDLLDTQPEIQKKLTIACAERNPQGKMIGIDRWGKEYASFSLPLCEKNAAAEGVKNASFRRGNAVKLDFPNESFDAVTSNYVYHNITGADKQALLLETLRVLKKGGTFAIHDLMSPRRYGNMQAFVQKLRDMGYERVKLIDTTDGSFMTLKEAGRLMLRGSTLLVGRK